MNVVVMVLWSVIKHTVGELILMQAYWYLMAVRQFVLMYWHMMTLSWSQLDVEVGISLIPQLASRFYYLEM